MNLFNLLWKLLMPKLYIFINFFYFIEKFTFVIYELIDHKILKIRQKIGN